MWGSGIGDEPHHASGTRSNLAPQASSLEQTAHLFRCETELSIAAHLHVPLPRGTLVKQVVHLHMILELLEEACQDAVLVRAHRDETRIPGRQARVVPERSDETAARRQPR